MFYRVFLKSELSAPRGAGGAEEKFFYCPASDVIFVVNVKQGQMSFRSLSAFYSGDFDAHLSVDDLSSYTIEEIIEKHFKSKPSTKRASK